MAPTKWRPFPRNLVKAAMPKQPMERGPSMKVNIDHIRNPVLGWDITVGVDAEEDEHIAEVEVRVNDFPEVRETLRKPLKSWEQQITQKGVYPGNNKVEVMVLDQESEETNAIQKWS
jgi:hypothetical protein